jgi:type VI secretion system protein ImpG
VTIFSVDDVVGTNPTAREVIQLEPFYSHRHGSAARSRVFWHGTRRAAGWRSDGGTDVYLSFVDAGAHFTDPGADSITARLTCFNADLPSQLPFGSGTGDFELKEPGPIRRISALVKPTSVVHPPLGRPQLWRLVSQLSLNYLSLVDGGGDQLREILRLHNFAGSAAAEQQIAGIVGVSSEPAFSRVASEHGLAFARGRRVELELDEEQFSGGSAYLLAAVLERFLGLYASMNSFTILAASTRQRQRPMRVWPPRSGWKALL